MAEPKNQIELPRLEDPSKLTSKEYNDLSSLKFKLKKDPSFKKLFSENVKNDPQYNEFVKSLKLEVGGYFSRFENTKSTDFYDVYKTICDGLGVEIKSDPIQEIAELKNIYAQRNNPVQTPVSAPAVKSEASAQDAVPVASKPSEALVVDAPKPETPAAQPAVPVPTSEAKTGDISDKDLANSPVGEIIPESKNIAKAVEPSAIDKIYDKIFGDKNKDTKVENAKSEIKKYLDILQSNKELVPESKKNIVEKILQTASKHYYEFPEFREKFTLPEFLSLTIVESGMTPDIDSSSIGLCQITTIAVNDIRKDRPDNYNKKFFKSFDPKKNLRDVSNNIVCGMTLLDGMYQKPDSRYSLKYDAEKNRSDSRLEEGNVRAIMNDVKLTSEGKGIPFDEKLFYGIIEALKSPENEEYRKKFNALYQYNTVFFAYPFRVLYISEKTFGTTPVVEAGIKKYETKKMIEAQKKQEAADKLAAEKQEAAAKKAEGKNGKVDASSKGKEKSGPKEYLIGENVVSFGDSWAAGLKETNKGGKNVHGFPGKSSDFISQRFTEFVNESITKGEKLDGKTLTINAGINDASNPSVLTNIEGMIRLAQSKGMKVVVSNYCTDHPAAKIINDKLKTFAKNYQNNPGVSFVDLYKDVPGQTTNLHPYSKYPQIITRLQQEVSRFS